MAACADRAIDIDIVDVEQCSAGTGGGDEGLGLRLTRVPTFPA